MPQPLGLRPGARHHGSWHLSLSVQPSATIGCGWCACGERHLRTAERAGCRAKRGERGRAAERTPASSLASLGIPRRGIPRPQAEGLGPAERCREPHTHQDPQPAERIMDEPLLIHRQ